MHHKIREPIVEGIFYPSDPEHLNQLIKQLLDESQMPSKNIHGLIVPHAGYRYAGTIAADAYKAIKNRVIRRIIILAPVHRELTDEIILPESNFFRMPSGLIPVDHQIIDDIASCSTSFRKDDIPHLEEHCIEVQLPFIHYLFPDVSIVPILFGKLKKKAVKAFENALRLSFPKIKDESLFIVSSNMTSYLQGSSAETESKLLLDFILKNNPDGIFEAIESGEISSCGAICIALLLYFFGKNVTIQLFSQGNSGQTNNNYDERVQYASIGIYKVNN